MGQPHGAFWWHLSKEEDLRFLFTALTRLLGNHLDAANTLLPLSQKGHCLSFAVPPGGSLPVENFLDPKRQESPFWPF